jgi:hypothetical protein
VIGVLPELRPVGSYEPRVSNLYKSQLAALPSFIQRQD